MKSPTEAFADLISVLNERDRIQFELETEDTKLASIQEKITEFLLASQTEIDVEYDARIPYVCFKMMPKQAGTAMDIYKDMDKKKADHNAAAKKTESELKEGIEEIGNWLLAEANTQGVKGFSSDRWTSFKQRKTQVSASDFAKFMQFVVKEGAEDAAIQKRVNAAFVDKYEKDNDELPPFLNVHREFKMVVRKK